MRFDEIGYWSELKLEIIKKYAQAYSTILAAQQSPRLKHVYMDGFSGAGEHVSKGTGEMVPGSPLNALQMRTTSSVIDVFWGIVVGVGLMG